MTAHFPVAPPAPVAASAAGVESAAEGDVLAGEGKQEHYMNSKVL